jgi:transketolase C-terminal domain/subunit
LIINSQLILFKKNPKTFGQQCFIVKENHNIYFGLGENINYFTGLLVPNGVQFVPFEKFNRFSFHIELQPSFDINEDVIIQASWGLRYKFESTPKSAFSMFTSQSEFSML